MLTVLFWNTMRRDLSESVARMARHNAVDIIVLAERGSSPVRVVAALNSGGDDYHYSEGYEDEPVAIFANLTREQCQPVSADARAAARRIVTPDRPPLLLIGAHLRSKLHGGEVSQPTLARRFANWICALEQQEHHARTAVVGDFNMDPFEEGLVDCDSLHAVSSRQQASKGSRIVDRQERHYFYNPMWGQMGDLTPGPPGTYYRNTGSAVCYFWNTFDQVLLRPALLEFFTPSDVSILTNDGEFSLVDSNGIPDQRHFSDHLPLLFRLHL